MQKQQAPWVALVFLALISIGLFLLLKSPAAEHDPKETLTGNGSASDVDQPELRTKEMSLKPVDESGSVVPYRVVAEDRKILIQQGEVVAMLTEQVTSGRVLLQELDGTERAEEDGLLRLILWSGETKFAKEVTITKGQWRLSLEVDENGSYSIRDDRGETFADISKVTVERGEFQDTLGVPFESDAGLELGSDEIVVDLMGIHKVELIVQDARTGVNLEGVHVIANNSWMDSQIMGPDGRSPEHYLVRNAQSPVAVIPTSEASFEDVVNCLVGAEGYGWKEIELDFYSGVTRTVLLEPGGNLTVYLTLAPDHEEVELRLFTRRIEKLAPGELSSGEWEQVWHKAPSGIGPYEFTGLPTGDLRIAVELGNWYSNPLVLGSEVVNIEAGKTAATTLTCEQVPELTEARFAGKLLLSELWGIKRPRLTMRLLGVPLDGGNGQDTARAKSSAAGVYEFDFKELQVGSYNLSCAEVKYSMRVELTASGEQNFIFEVPPPVEVQVQLVDSATGATAPLRDLFWFPSSPTGIQHGASESSEREPGEESFRLVVPQGLLKLSAGGDGYRFSDTVVEAQAGAKISFYIDPAIEAVFQLVDAETKEPLPWPTVDGHFPTVENVENPEVFTPIGIQGGVVVATAAPGRYRMEITTLDGYRVHEPIEFELVAGVPFKLDIELTKLP